MKIKATVLTKRGNYFELMLPAMRIVCERCGGSGVHDHSSFSNGVSADNFQDPDFAENYFSGRYDVRCEECEGKNVVLVVDEDSLTPKMLKRYFAYVDECARSDREYAAEQRYFARASGEF